MHWTNGLYRPPNPNPSPFVLKLSTPIAHQSDNQLTASPIQLVSLIIRCIIRCNQLRVLIMFSLFVINEQLVCQQTSGRLSKRSKVKVKHLLQHPFLCRHGPPQRCSSTWCTPSSIAHTCLIPYTQPQPVLIYQGWRVE